MTYICLNCGEEFSHPTILEDRHGGPFGLGEKYRVSPCCHDGFTAAVTCPLCGELTAAGYDSHGLCRKCAEKTVERLQYFLYNEFTEAQREVLNDAFDGVALTDPDEAKVVLP